MGIVGATPSSCKSEEKTMNVIQQANKDARINARRTNAVIKRDGKRAAAICKALQKAGVNISYVNIDSCTYNLNIAGSRADLDVMFGILRRAGLAPDSRPGEKESSFCTYWRAEDFRLWIFFTSTSCKRVQVGTELKETPIYETVCED
jgi:hypothetical protein